MQAANSQPAFESSEKERKKWRGEKLRMKNSHLLFVSSLLCAKQQKRVSTDNSFLDLVFLSHKVHLQLTIFKSQTYEAAYLFRMHKTWQCLRLAITFSECVNLSWCLLLLFFFFFFGAQRITFRALGKVICTHPYTHTHCAEMKLEVATRSSHKMFFIQVKLTEQIVSIC